MTADDRRWTQIGAGRPLQKNSRGRLFHIFSMGMRSITLKNSKLETFQNSPSRAFGSPVNHEKFVGRASVPAALEPPARSHAASLIRRIAAATGRPIKTIITLNFSRQLLMSPWFTSKS